MYEFWKDVKADEELVDVDVAARLSLSRALDIKISPRVISSSGVTGEGADSLPWHESVRFHDLSKCFQGCCHSCRSGWVLLLENKRVKKSHAFSDEH